MKYLLGVFISIVMAAGVWFAVGYFRNLRAFLNARRALDAERAALARRACRRDLIGTVLSIVIGMLGTGFALEKVLLARPLSFGIYWLVVLILVVWVLLLGFYDMREVLRSFRRPPRKR